MATATATVCLEGDNARVLLKIDGVQRDNEFGAFDAGKSIEVKTSQGGNQIRCVATRQANGNVRFVWTVTPPSSLTGGKTEVKEVSLSQACAGVSI